LYSVEVTIAYRLLYWDGRRARDVSRHALPVQGNGVHLDIPRSSLPAPMPRQPSLLRSNAMSRERQSSYLASLSPKARHQHHLKPIEQQFPLPGGGHLGVSYRLIKGHHRDPDRSGCSYGHNPDTNEVESYFSTQDTAVLELTLHNESHHDLKHVFLAGIRIMSINDEKTVNGPANETLPDGNLLFEVVPNDVYFGHIDPNEKEVRFLSLITRGTASGHYAVQFHVHYDIEQCRVPVNLWLTVRPD
jgi:hypothetical protein